MASFLGQALKAKSKLLLLLLMFTTSA